MSTIAITPTQQRLLDRINTRLDQLDTATSPAVAGSRVRPTPQSEENPC